MPEPCWCGNPNCQYLNWLQAQLDKKVATDETEESV